MTKRMAPSFEMACSELDRHFAKYHRVLTTRQLKAACGGSGSNETYLVYIKRWRDKRIEESGVRSTVLSLLNHFDSFTKTTGLMLGTLSDQLRMCPIDQPAAEPEEPDEHGQKSAADIAESDVGSASEIEQQRQRDFSEQRRVEIEQRSDAAAKASEARYLDQGGTSSSERVHRRDPYGNDGPIEVPRSDERINSNASLSRAEEGSRQVAHSLGANQPGQGEREMRHNEGEA